MYKIRPQEDAFARANPSLADDMIRMHGGLEWIKSYVDESEGHITQAWERNSEGYLVDVTARERAREELMRAKEALEALRMKGELVCLR